MGMGVEQLRHRVLPALAVRPVLNAVCSRWAPDPALAPPLSARPWLTSASCVTTAEHLHFHVCAIDGVFEKVTTEGRTDSAVKAPGLGVALQPATGVESVAVTRVQTCLRKRSMGPAVCDWAVAPGWQRDV